jgi:hypothetical protein
LKVRHLPLMMATPVPMTVPKRILMKVCLSPAKALLACAASLVTLSVWAAPPQAPSAASAAAGAASKPKLSAQAAKVQRSGDNDLGGASTPPRPKPRTDDPMNRVKDAQKAVKTKP